MVETKHLQDVLEKHGKDMTDKVVAITGTTSGTGYICALELAKKGATVLLLNRKSDRSAAALTKLQEAAGASAKFEAIECDLQDYESVKKAAAAISAKHKVLDVLVNNAGVMALKDVATKDGYDVQMQTNVISHFLLTRDLFPLLKASAEARIVNHTSMARLGSPLETKYFEKDASGNLGGDGTPEENTKFQGGRWARYHQTKLGNACFTYALKNKLEAAGITTIIPLLAHPGLAATELQKTTDADGGMDSKSDFMNMAQSPEDGATGIIRASMDSTSKPGDFYGPTKGWNGFPDLLPPEELLTDESNLKILWDGCEKAVGEFAI